MGNVLLKATITSFAKKLVMNLSLADRRESLSCKFFYKMTRPDSFIHHLIPQKRNQKILSRLSNPSQYCIFLHVLKDSRNRLLYALRTFPMDIDDDSDDDFIDFWFHFTIVYRVLLSTFMYYCLYIQHLLPNIINESITQSLNGKSCLLYTSDAADE